jgi:hypothetical protein
LIDSFWFTEEYKPSSTVETVLVRRRILETGKTPLLQEERRAYLAQAFAPLRDMASLSQSSTDEIGKLIESQLQQLKASAPQSHSQPSAEVAGIGNPTLPAKQKQKRNQGSRPGAPGTKANKKNGKKQQQKKQQEAKNARKKILGQAEDGNRDWG